MRAMPATVASVHHQCCRQANCTHVLNYDDPCASCPEGHFPVWSQHCAEVDHPLPSQVQMAVNLAGAITRDVLAGCPRRTKEEADEIFNTICKPCEFLRSDNRCAQCGCPVVDKIPLGRERCPIGKW